MSGKLKLRVYHQPWTVLVIFCASVAVITVSAWLTPGRLGSVLTVVAVLYGLVAFIAAALAGLASLREGHIAFARPERGLIVAPHQDDCVLMAGGFGLCNRARGGETHIAYLVQPSDRQVAAVRRDEAVAAWRVGGIDARCLRHFSTLPAEGTVTQRDVERLAGELQRLVDDIAPTIVIVPAFEGGHIHHDIAHHVVTRMLRLPPGTRIFESPEYSPYFSLWRTPQAALSQLARIFLLGRVSYYPKPEGVGRGRILNVRLTPDQLNEKKGMLQAFRSQHGEALARNQGFEDRLIAWTPRPFQATPFVYRGSRPWLIERLQSIMPLFWILRLLPGEPCTIGLTNGITNLSAIIAADFSPMPPSQ